MTNEQFRGILEFVLEVVRRCKTKEEIEESILSIRKSMIADRNKSTDD